MLMLPESHAHLPLLPSLAVNGHSICRAQCLSVLHYLLGKFTLSEGIVSHNIICNRPSCLVSPQTNSRIFKGAAITPKGDRQTTWTLTLIQQAWCRHRRKYNNNSRFCRAFCQPPARARLQI
jgi:hypothetical protein